MLYTKFFSQSQGGACSNAPLLICHWLYFILPNVSSTGRKAVVNDMLKAESLMEAPLVFINIDTLV